MWYELAVGVRGGYFDSYIISSKTTWGLCYPIEKEMSTKLLRLNRSYAPERLDP